MYGAYDPRVMWGPPDYAHTLLVVKLCFPVHHHDQRSEGNASKQRWADTLETPEIRDKLGSRREKKREGGVGVRGLQDG